MKLRAVQSLLLSCILFSTSVGAPQEAANAAQEPHAQSWGLFSKAAVL